MVPRVSYIRGKGLLFGIGTRPADVLIFTHIPAPGVLAYLPTAIDLMMSVPFSTSRESSRKAARSVVESSDEEIDEAVTARYFTIWQF